MSGLQPSQKSETDSIDWDTESLLQHFVHERLVSRYVRENLRRTSPETAEERLRVSITARSNNARTVVVSPLPVTPDASFMLRVTCELKAEEVDAP